MTTNSELFTRAQQSIPGGVNSPVRAFKSVGGTPRFIARAQGSKVWDVEGKQYIDYVNSWGPAIVGHAHPAVISAVQEAAVNGLSFGAPTLGEVEIAEKLIDLLPSMEMVRLVSSGTEATMSAIRLARGYTGRDTLVKFEGCYHGHSDGLLVKAGSGALTFGTPSSGGVPADVVKHTLVLDYNNLAQLEETFAKQGSSLAAVIIEPIAGNMNLVAPSLEYMQKLRELCTAHGVVLIYDEVMTGFRVGLKGAQALFGITPDLTTLGKVIGGGMPVGAFGGKREIMEKIAPLGSVYQAGTLSGSPVAVAAGLATLKLVEEADFYENLSAKAEDFTDSLNLLAHKYNVEFCAQSFGGMFGLYFRKELPTNFEQVMDSNVERFKAFFHFMLERGHYFAPSAFEAGFISAAHSQEDIEATLEAAEEFFAQL